MPASISTGRVDDKVAVSSGLTGQIDCVVLRSRICQVWHTEKVLHNEPDQELFTDP